MKAVKPLLIMALVLSSTGCYHAMVTTGMTPGSKVVDHPWAMGWAFGLVPPKAVDGAAECPNGVAIVETELSFLNQLVSGLTGGILTPMHIKVTCAADGAASTLQPDLEVRVSEGADVVEAFELAANEAAATGSPVVVRFE